MKKIILIGIDGLDYDLLSKFESNLPNFSKLKKGSKIKMESVFPPDSPTAWSSIYTGLNPAEHGIISFKDPSIKFKVCDYLGTDISGKTFWDKVSNAGKEVCIVFPHLGYPVWDVNGVMVGRTTEVDVREFDIQTYPPALSEKYDLSNLKPISSYPIKIGDIIEPTKELIKKEVSLGLKLLRDVEWDLYFMYFSSLDNIEHLFWMYYDENDPDYEEGNIYKNVIPDFYKFYDKEVLGKFLEFVDQDVTFILVSDHGHAMRPTNIVNFNEILRRKGFLDSKTNQNMKYRSLEKLKKEALKNINNHRAVGKLASKILAFFPKSASIYLSTTPINMDETVAYISDPSGGLKAYSYAGIKIKREKVTDYEETRDEIINLVSYIEDPFTSKNLVEWVLKREDLYSGEYLDKYPDVLLKLKDNWGVGWDINKEVFDKTHSHKLHSGNHRQDTPVFLTKNLDLEVKEKLELMDISKIICDILGVDPSNE